MTAFQSSMNTSSENTQFQNDLQHFDPSEESMMISLVEAVREHLDFQQLTSYSIQCISKCLDMRRKDWRQLMDKAIECDAVDIILDAMMKYTSFEDVLLPSAKCLCTLVLDPNTAFRVYERLQEFETLFDLIDGLQHASSASTITELMTLCDKLCDYHRILRETSQETIHKVIDLIEKQRNQPEVIIISLKVFDKFLSGGCIDPNLAVEEPWIIRLLMDVLGFYTKDLGHCDNARMIVSCIVRVFVRLTHVSKDAIEVIKNVKGYDIFLEILEGWTDSQNSTTNRNTVRLIGGRLLSRLVNDRDIILAIPSMMCDGFNNTKLEKDLKHLLAIIENNDNIVSDLDSSHINCLLKAFGTKTISPRALILLSEVLKVIVNNKNIAKLIAKSDIGETKRKLIALKTPIEVVLNLILFYNAIINSCDSDEDCYHLIESIDKSILEVINIYNKEEEVVLSALKLLTYAECRRNESSLASSQYEDYPMIIYSAMKCNIRNKVLLFNGMKILSKLISLQRFVDSITASHFNEILLFIVQIINELHVDRSLLYVSLQAVYEMLTYRKQKLSQTELGIIFVSISSASLDISSDHDSLNIARKILFELKSDNYLKRICHDLQEFKEGRFRTNNRVDSLKSLLQGLQVILIDPCDGEVILKHNGFLFLEEIMFQIDTSLEDRVNYILLIVLTINSLLEKSVIGRQNISVIQICYFIYNVLNQSQMPHHDLVLQWLLLLKNSLHHECQLGFDHIDVPKLIGVASMHLESNNIIIAQLDILLILISRGQYHDVIHKNTATFILRLLESQRNNHPVLYKTLLVLNEIMKYELPIEYLKSSNISILNILFQVHTRETDSKFFNLIESIIKQFISKEDLIAFIMKFQKFTTFSSAEYNRLEVNQIIQEAIMLLTYHDDNVEEKNGLIMCVISFMESLDISHCTFNSSVDENVNAMALKALSTVKTDTETVKSAILKLTPKVFIMVKESPSLISCMIMCDLLKNEHAVDAFLKNADVSFKDIFSCLIHKGMDDFRFGVFAIEAAQYIIKRCTDASKWITENENDGLDQLCTYALISLERSDIDGFIKSLGLLSDAGRHNSDIFYSISVISLIKEGLRYDLKSALFPHIAKFMKNVATYDEIKWKESKEWIQIYSQLISSFVIIYDRGELNAEILNAMSQLTEVLFKNKKNRTKLNCDNDRLKLIFGNIALQYPICYASITTACKYLHTLRDEDELPDWTSVSDKISRVSRQKDRKNSKANYVTNLLQDLHRQLLFVQKDDLKISDVQTLLESLQNVLEYIESYDHKQRQDIRYFILQTINQLLHVSYTDHLNSEVFVNECIHLASDTSRRYRAAAFSCISAIAKNRQGLDAVVREDVLQCLQNSLPLLRLEESAVKDSNFEDEKSAVDTMSIICKLICERSPRLNRSSEGIELIATFICYSAEYQIANILSKICEEEEDVLSILYRLLNILITRKKSPASALKCILEQLDKRQNEFIVSHLNIVITASTVYPGYLALLQKATKTSDASNLFGEIDHCVKIISEVIYNHAHIAHHAAAIYVFMIEKELKSCVLQMKDANVARRLLNSLDILAHDVDNRFVEDALKVIRYLVFKFSLSSLNFDAGCIDILVMLSRGIQLNNYVNNLLKDIISKLSSDSLSQEQESKHSKALELHLLDKNRVDGGDIVREVIIEINKNESSKDFVKVGLEKVLRLLCEVEEDGGILDSFPLELLQDLSNLLKQHGSYRDLLFILLNIFGILAISEINVVKIVDCDIPKFAVSNMDSFLTDQIMMELAVKLISNLGYCSIDKYIQSRLVSQGCHDFILESAEKYQTSSSLLKMILLCMYNLNLNNDTNLHVRTLRKVVYLMEVYKFDREILYPALKVCSTFTCSENGLSVLMELEGQKLLFRLICIYKCIDEKVIALILLCMTNITISSYRKDSMTSEDNIKLIEDCLGKFSTDECIAKYAMTIFSLVTEEQKCASVSQHGLYISRITADVHANNETVTLLFLEVISNLSQTKNKIAGIVQNDVIPTLFAIFKAHKRNNMVLTTLLKIFWDLLVGSDESKSILIAAGIEDFIQENMQSLTQQRTVKMADKILATVNHSSRHSKTTSPTSMFASIRRQSLFRRISVSSLKV